MAYLRSGSQRQASAAREVMPPARLLNRAPRGLLLRASQAACERARRHSSTAQLQLSSDTCRGPILL